MSATGKWNARERVAAPASPVCRGRMARQALRGDRVPREIQGRPDRMELSGHRERSGRWARRDRREKRVHGGRWACRDLWEKRGRTVWRVRRDLWEKRGPRGRWDRKG
ncbi:hypothetical protein PAMA110636_28725 [Paenibacillus macerans]